MLMHKIIAVIPVRYHPGLKYLGHVFFDIFSRKSYAQEGEDLLLERIFANVDKGFYVDVGAHHPVRFSNTFIFYQKGWSGINIDAMPNSMKLFKKIRPRDINLEIPVSDKEQVLTYYAFKEPALNGFSKDLSASRVDLYNQPVLFEKDLKTQPLAKILDEYLPAGQKIHFLSIDVEGLDYQVLLSNDWDKYRPEIVVVEMLSAHLEDVFHSEAARFMKSRGYTVFAKIVNSVFFKLQVP